MMDDIFTAEKLNDAICGRSLFIWGCGHLGVTLLNRFMVNGFQVNGFIDRSDRFTEISGVPVFRPDQILKNPKIQPFIVISAVLYEDEIALSCIESGLVEHVDFVRLSRLKPYHFEIDIAGSCNLRCATCPRGNSPVHYNDGMMSFETYREVLDKIVGEFPLIPDIQLYSWGEPLLNRDLPQMIRYTAQKGVSSAISSNLSLSVDLEEVVKAGPQWFRVSLSGFEASYSVMHKGGRWETVLANLKELARCRDLFAQDMIVEVNYHIYKHNIDDIEKMRLLCDQLKFVFQPNYAFIDPLELLIEFRKSGTLPESVSGACDNLMIDIDSAMEAAAAMNDSFCPCEKNICISADLRVMNCSHLFDPQCNTLCSNFLEMPFHEILELMQHRSACSLCRAFSLNSYYTVYLSKNDRDLHRSPETEGGSK